MSEYWPDKNVVAAPGTEARSPHHRRILIVCPFTPSLVNNPGPLLGAIGIAARQAAERCVVLFSTPTAEGEKQLYEQLREAPKESFKTLAGFLATIYATLAAGQWEVKRPLSEVEVHFDGEKGDWAAKVGTPTLLYTFSGLDLAHDILEVVAPNLREEQQVVLPSAGVAAAVEQPGELTLDLTPNPGYDVSAMGGTFDHLHAAHKYLLHMASFVTEKRLIVGVMADDLLKSKLNAQILEPIDVRIESCKAFLRRCGGEARGLVLDVVEIHDTAGPTAWDPEVTGIIVSRETLPGAKVVNNIRKEKGLGQLEVQCIDVISSQLGDDRQLTVDLTHADDKTLKDVKLGSTAIRQFIADLDAKKK